MIFHIQDNGHYFLLRQHFYELNDVKRSICEHYKNYSFPIIENRGSFASL